MASRTLISSIGLEIEFAGIPKNYGELLRRETTWRLVEDGSCRSRRNVIPGIPIETRGGSERTMFGGEFVSPVIDTETNEVWKEELVTILEWLASSGEGLDVKTAIHVHVNVEGIPLFAIQNLLRLGLFIEAGIYRLACAEMGVHRGSLHLDYGYCRPISEMGPPVVVCNDEVYRPIFDTNRLLSVTSLSQLRQALGRYDRHGGSKYHEARYVWLNLISMYQLGSVEFRLFNSTYSYRNVLSWVDLCQHFVRASFTAPAELPVNPLGSDTLQLEDIVNVLNIRDGKTLYTLENLWNSTEYQRGVRGYQMGHLEHMTNWGRSLKAIRPEPIDPSQIHSFHEFSLGNNPQPVVNGWYTLRS